MSRWLKWLVAEIAAVTLEATCIPLHSCLPELPNRSRRDCMILRAARPPSFVLSVSSEGRGDLLGKASELLLWGVDHDVYSLSAWTVGSALVIRKKIGAVQKPTA